MNVAAVPPIVQLAHHTLRGAHVSLGPSVHPQQYADAVALIGFGVDHLAGEQALGVLHHEYDRQGTREDVVVTDRRVFGRAHGPTRPYQPFDIPLAHVVSSRAETGLLKNAVHVQVGNGIVDVDIFGAQLAPFFQAIPQLHPAHRVAPLPLPTPSEHDPIGSTMASQLLLSGDARVPLLLRLFWEAHQRNEIATADAAAMIGRCVLLDRALRFGRGTSHGHFSTVLPRRALSIAMHMLFGEPMQKWPTEQHETLDFPTNAKRNVAGSVASSAVGVASLLVFGVGWVSRPGAPPPSVLRTVLVDLPAGGAGFALLGSRGAAFLPMAAMLPRWCSGIHVALLRIESRFLLAHALLSTRRSFETLLLAPREELQHAVAQRLGPVDLSAFYPPPQK